MESAGSEARITHIAMEHGLWNTLVCAISLFLVWGAMTGLLSLTLYRDFSNAAVISLVSLSALSVVAFIGSWIHGLRHRGKILLDCGPHPMWLQLGIMASVMNFVMLLFVVPSLLSNSGDQVGDKMAFLVVMIGFCLIQALGRLQICELGIWVYCGIVPWNRIDTYQWKDEGTLAVMPGSRFPLFRGVIAVPPSQKEELTRLLEVHGNANAAPNP